MGKGIIRPLFKWNLEKNSWEKAKFENIGRCFAFGDYEKIINNDSKDFNYIIFIHGSRVEDHTKTMFVSEKRMSINNMLDYLKSKKNNYKFLTLLMDADAPINEDCKLLAFIIDMLADKNEVKSINIAGLSKGAALAFNTPKYFVNPKSYAKFNSHLIAAPYDGTLLASPNIFNPMLQKFINDKLGDNIISKGIYNKIVAEYEAISSNSHMDYDIAMKDGIFDENKDRYDEAFIGTMFSDQNILANNKIRTITNYVTGINDKTLKNAILSMNPIGVGLCFIDKYFFDGKSDGMVSKSSQIKINDYMDTGVMNLDGAHHSVNTTPYMRDILWNICDKIDETLEEQKLIKKMK